MTNIIELKSYSKELLRVSAPLMISMLSTLSMVFANRIFLSNYSIDALNATVSTGTVAFSITFGVQTLTLIASVFVSQLNGANKKQDLGAPVWQMIWLSFATCIIFIPLGLLSDYMPFRNEQHTLVFKSIMFISPLFALLGSIQSFFNGRKKTLIITYTSLIGDLVSISLSPILIFGIKGYIPSIGVIGAFASNGIGISVSILILIHLFLSKKNRKNFGTYKFRINFRLMKNCIRVGTPDAFGVGMEILCWGIFYIIMETIDETHILVASISQSVILLFFFFGIGLQQGTSIVSGNLIGANRKNEVYKVLHAGIFIVLLSSIAVFTIFKIFPNFIVDLFFFDKSNMKNLSNTEILFNAINMVTQNLPLIAIYLCFEYFRFIICGLLRAAGDTLFLLLISVTNIILFLIIPTYILMLNYRFPIQFFFYIWIFFAFMSSIVVCIRFFKASWKNLSIMR